MLDGALTPAVMGTVYRDANGNGAPDAGEGLADLSLELFQDDGDGVFDEMSDALQATVTTDTQGAYCFDLLDSAVGYFVRQPSQTVSGSTFFELVSPLLTFDESDLLTQDVVQPTTADLTVAKTTDVSSLIPGETVQYRITVTNQGPDDAFRVSVADEFPPELIDVSYTSAAIGDVSGHTPQGVGNIDDLINIAANSALVYQVTARVSPDATGPLSNTAAVGSPDDPNDENNTATEVDELTPVAELSISKTSQVDNAAPGDTVAYTIVVHNGGPSTAPGTHIADDFPDGLMNVSYTRDDGQSTIVGTGDIDDTLDLSVGQTVTYRVTGVVSPTVGPLIRNTAVVTARDDVADPFPDNNSSTEDVGTNVSRTVLGSAPTLLHSGFLEGVERFEVTAHATGLLLVTAHFDVAPADVAVTIVDRAGNLVAEGASNEELAIPVVFQEDYFISVSGPVDESSFAFDLEIENFAISVPEVVRLTPDSDTGRFDNDANTADGTPVILVQADLERLLSRGITLLEPVDPGADNQSLPAGAGVAVKVTITDAANGQSRTAYASSIGGSLFAVTPLTTSPLTDGSYLVTAVVEVFDGSTNAQTRVSGRGLQSESFWLTIDQTPPTASDQPDLLTASDTGMSLEDNVTSKMQPAFAGIGEPNTIVRVIGNRLNLQAEVIGQGFVNASGQWEVTVEPLADDKYNIRAEFEDLAGNVSDIGEPLAIEIDSQAPNTPLLDLLPLTDTGLSDSDNTTAENTLTFSMTTSDPAPETHLSPFNLKYRLYLRADDGGTETLVYDSSTDTEIPAANVVDGLTDLHQLTKSVGLFPDGVHNFKLEVEDRAGNISDDFLLTVTIDTEAPPADIDLIEASDTGVFADDNVTHHTQPALAGVSEVGATVSILANGQVVGQGRVGSDETDGNPNDGLGAWEVTVEPLRDDRYLFEARIEDLAGNVALSESLEIWIDAVAPNLPLLDLVTDTGHSPDDEITSDNTPTVLVTANDTTGGGDNPFPNDIQYRIYDRFGLLPEQLLVDSFVTLGGLSTQGIFTVTLPELADGTHHLKLEVEDRAGNLSHDFLLEVEIDTEAPVIGSFQMADLSDSGMSDQDRVTNIRRPAFFGLSTPGDEVLLFANGEPVGHATVNSDASDGNPDDGLGLWEITVEPLDDGVYDVVAQIEDWAGNVATSDPITIEIDTLAPNTPRLDLAEEFDTGRHNDDNITALDQLGFSATTTDPNAANHLVLFPNGQNLKYRLFLRPESGAEMLVYDSAVDPALPDLLDGLTAASLVLIAIPDLPDGLHNFKLEVEDRAGNISHDFLLDLLVDLAAFGGDGRLDPDSDTGVISLPPTFSDSITQDQSPVFVGRAEANALVTLTIDGEPAGTTVAVPLDGDDAVHPPNAPFALDGNWRLSSTRALEDGEHTAHFTYEDPAGNRDVSTLTFVVDTEGPRVENVTLDEEGFPSVFDPKPTSGPDPLIDRLVIHFTDGPAAVQDIPLAIPLLEEEGNYRVVGDANGHIPIVQVEVDFEPINGGGQVVTRATLVFNEPLPDDRFTLTVSDSIRDIAGNRLDGESGAASPFEGAPGISRVNPVFPSGDGVPGGDFVARFTVDSRPEIGSWAAGSVYVDINGNFRFDPDNIDPVNRDIVFTAGFTSDDVFAGNFALFPDDVTDGFDKLAVYGRFAGSFRFLVDTDNDGVPNIDRTDPHNANGLPVAGRFDASESNGDEVGVFDGQAWYLDTDHDFRTDLIVPSHLKGYPIVGDFDGDGFDDLAAWSDNRFMIDFADGALRGWDGFVDRAITFGFAGVRERPVAADMDQDGFDDLGIWVPDREGVAERTQSEWYFLISGGDSLLDRISPPDDPVDSRPTIDFTPVPFGNDIFAQFGDEFALPVVGNFDPPTVLLDLEEEESSPPPVNSMDVNGDGVVTPLDALFIINDLNEFGPRPLLEGRSTFAHLDVNGDRYVTPMDALLILNQMNHPTAFAARAIPADARANVAAAILADDVFQARSFDGSRADGRTVDAGEADAVLGKSGSGESRIDRSSAVDRAHRLRELAQATHDGRRDRELNDLALAAIYGEEISTEPGDRWDAIDVL